MVLSLLTTQSDALKKRTSILRSFVYCEARDPFTGDPAHAGFWNGTGNIQMPDGKIYYGSGTLGVIASQSSRSDFSIPGLTITLSGISPAVAALVRNESVGQAPITVSLGIYDTETRELIGGLIPRFVGRVDDVEIKDPAKGGTCEIVFTLESDSRALTLQRPDRRVQEDQLARQPGDDFYKWASSAREARIYFGMPTPRTAKRRSPKNDA